MKKFENPSLPAPIYIYCDIFYTPCLPYHYFHLENIDDLKTRLKIGDDLIECIVNAYYKNKTLLPSEGYEILTDVTNSKIARVDSKGCLNQVSANDNTHLTLLAYGNKNHDTLRNIVKLNFKPIDLALAERDDLPTDIVITLLNKRDVTANTILLKNGRYNDDETLLSAIDTGSPRIIEAIAEKRDISLTVFKALEKFYDNKNVLINLMNNKNLPEYMLADIVELNNLSAIAQVPLSFHPQYTQYMDEYRIFRNSDIHSAIFKEKAQNFFNKGDYIPPLYRVKL